MSAYERWQENNSRFLSAALSWLRGRLERRISAGDGSPESGNEESLVDVLAAGSNNSSPALAVLASRLGLSSFEQQVLLLAAAAEWDPDLPALFDDNVSVFECIWYGRHEVSRERVDVFAANVERIKAVG